MSGDGSATGTVEVAQRPNVELAYTGADVAGEVFAASVLIAGGAIVLAIRRSYARRHANRR